MINVNEKIFYYYLYFMHERMNIFWQKYNGFEKDLTKDEIFKTYKFTNVYRACDRVSQYLINNVIYKAAKTRLNERDILFRIIVFKIFNKIETWEYLENELGLLEVNNFDLK